MATPKTRPISSNSRAFSRKATATFDKYTHTNLNLEKIDWDLNLSRNKDILNNTSNFEEPYKSSRVKKEEVGAVKCTARALKDPKQKWSGLFNTISIRKGF